MEDDAVVRKRRRIVVTDDEDDDSDLEAEAAPPPQPAVNDRPETRSVAFVRKFCKQGVPIRDPDVRPAGNWHEHKHRTSQPPSVWRSFIRAHYKYLDVFAPDGWETDDSIFDPYTNASQTKLECVCGVTGQYRNAGFHGKNQFWSAGEVLVLAYAIAVGDLFGSVREAMSIKSKKECESKVLEIVHKVFGSFMRLYHKLYRGLFVRPYQSIRSQGLINIYMGLCRKAAALEGKNSKLQTRIMSLTADAEDFSTHLDEVREELAKSKNDKEKELAKSAVDKKRLAEIEKLKRRAELSEHEALLEAERLRRQLAELSNKNDEDLAAANEKLQKAVEECEKERARSAEATSLLENSVTANIQSATATMRMVQELGQTEVGAGVIARLKGGNQLTNGLSLDLNG